MASNKTQPTDVSPQEFVDAVEHKVRRADAETLLGMMREISGQQAVMWGPSIIGCGSYHYKYDSGREGDMCRIGFSPRKTKLALYLVGSHERFAEPLSRLGKHKKGAGCLYINKLADVDIDVLRELIDASYRYSLEAYPEAA